MTGPESGKRRFDPARYWEARLSSGWNLQGVGYRSLGGGFNWWAYRVRRSVFLRVLRECRLTVHDALDFGAGTGFFTKLLLDGGWSVSAIDITSTAVANLRSAFPAITVTQGTAMHIVGEYDLIVAMDVLFHIVDDRSYRETLSLFQTHLRDGGVLVFTENLPRMEVRREHIVSRSDTWVMEALAAAGFEVLLRRPFFVLMNAPIKRSRSLRWRVLEAVLHRLPWLGGVIGALLYPIESILVRKRRTDSSEIVVCRKRAGE